MITVRKLVIAVLSSLALAVVLLAGLAFWALQNTPPPKPELAGRIEPGELQHDGRSRSWIAYLPAQPAPHPALVIVLSLLAALGPGMLNLILALAILGAAGTSRVIRGATLATLQHPYVEAARALGSGHLRIIVRHVLPNVLATIIILATVALGTVILAESALSFLGFGVPPPYPSWGGMLSGSGRSFMYHAPWMALCPGAAISLAVFGFNMLGDALRDLLDPRLRGGR